MPTPLPLASLLTFAPLAAAAQEWPVGQLQAPSGLEVMLTDVVFEENPWSGEMLVVVRLLVPSIAS